MKTPLKIEIPKDITKKQVKDLDTIFPHGIYNIKSRKGKRAVYCNYKTRIVLTLSKEELEKYINKGLIIAKIFS